MSKLFFFLTYCFPLQTSRRAGSRNLLNPLLRPLSFIRINPDRVRIISFFVCTNMYLEYTGAMLRQMMMHLAPLMNLSTPQPPLGPGTAPAAQGPQQQPYLPGQDPPPPPTPPLPTSANPYNGTTPQYYQSQTDFQGRGR